MLGPLQRIRSFTEAPLFVKHPRQIERPVRGFDPLDLTEGLFRLAQFPLALAQQPDAVVVPTLPFIDRFALLRNHPANNRQRHPVFSQRDDGQIVVYKIRAFYVT